VEFCLLQYTMDERIRLSDIYMREVSNTIRCYDFAVLRGYILFFLSTYVGRGGKRVYKRKAELTISTRDPSDLISLLRQIWVGTLRELVAPFASR
jgi:hypothetical protein